MSNKLVSVIIPVYNVKEAIQSIQNQTYKNLEIIIIDDTYKIVEELVKDDNRIKMKKILKL